MDAALLHQAAAERQTLGRVVVAADEEGLRIALRQLHEKLVEQRDRLSGRNRLVVDVARDEHAVRLLAVDDAQDLL